MENPFDNEAGEFLVLVNDEGQYSIWPASIDVPPGWQITGPRGSRQECIDFVDKEWTDMRPKSLIKRIAEAEAASTEKPRVQ